MRIETYFGVAEYREYYKGCIRPSGRMRIETTTHGNLHAASGELHPAFRPDED